jgi:subtilisin family serine protease
LLALESNKFSPENALTYSRNLLTAAFDAPPHAIALEGGAFSTDPGIHVFDANCDQLPTLQRETVGTAQIKVRDLRAILGIGANSTGRGRTIAVIDGGASSSSGISGFSRQFLRSDYPYLNPEVADTRDGFDCRETTPVDGHGRLVTGIIRAVAPEANLIALKACNDQGFCPISSVAKALLYLRNRYRGLPAVDVINMSFGGLSSTGDPLSAAIIADMSFAQPNTLFVASAGNTRDAANHFPAGLSRQSNTVLPVAATKYTAYGWELASFNTCKVLLEAGIMPLGAPGVNLIVSDGGVNRSITGTSFAAPIVSALAALKRQGNPKNLASASSLIQNLHDTAYPLGSSTPVELARF